MMSRPGQQYKVQVRQARMIEGGCYFSFLSARPVPSSHADWQRGKQEASPKGNGAGSALKLFVPSLAHTVAKPTTIGVAARYFARVGC